jgi:oligopeptide/dipeptide ABC transporter ATP-binding protein
MMDAVLEARDLYKHFPVSRSLFETVQRSPKEVIHAVDGVSLRLHAGEALGVIGESGSGKTTLGWTMARLHDPTQGSIRLAGNDITNLHGSALLAIRRKIQVVFQDPVGSLDPRLRVWRIVGEPAQAQGHSTRAELRSRVAEILPTVGLPADALDQYPHEFSGGGRQRLALARALIVHPEVVVLDEPTSALDVAVQAQILNRLVTLQREMGLSYLMITHNVAAVRYVADRVAVMYLGKLAEVGRVRDVLEHPVHPYTKALLAALPTPEPGRRKARYRVAGEIPTMIHPPVGCRFAARCPFVIPRCIEEEPLLRSIPGSAERLVACHRAEEIGDVPPEELVRSVGGAPVSAQPRPESTSAYGRGTA